MSRVVTDLRQALPWRTRARLLAVRRVDALAGWFLDHDRPELAVRVWKAAGLWK